MVQDPDPNCTSEDRSDKVNANNFLSIFYYKGGGSEQSDRSKLNAMLPLLHNISGVEWGAEIPESDLSELLEEFSFLDISGIGHLSIH